MDRSSRQKINKEVQALNGTLFYHILCWVWVCSLPRKKFSLEPKEQLLRSLQECKALVKVRKTRLEQLEHEGNKNAKKALKLVNETNKMLAAAQLGVTIASIALGWVAEATMVELVEPKVDVLVINYDSIIIFQMVD